MADGCVDIVLSLRAKNVYFLAHKLCQKSRGHAFGKEIKRCSGLPCPAGGSELHVRHIYARTQQAKKKINMKKTVWSVEYLSTLKKILGKGIVVLPRSVHPFFFLTRSNKTKSDIKSNQIVLNPNQKNKISNQIK